jgi:hypothetical protein
VARDHHPGHVRHLAVNDNVNIYEVHNNGNWYNFGFMFGLSIVFGSRSRASASAKRPTRSSR